MNDCEMVSSPSGCPSEIVWLIDASEVEIVIRNACDDRVFGQEEDVMYSHILIPTDGGELSADAARKALEVAKTCGAKVTTILVSPPYRHILDDGSEAPTVESVRKQWEMQRNDHAKQILDRICADAAQAGIACNSTHVFGDLPYESIIDCANKNGCDMIAMGSHGYGEIKQFFIGSQTTQVLSHTKIPVVVYR